MVTNKGIQFGTVNHYVSLVWQEKRKIVLRIQV